KHAHESIGKCANAARSQQHSSIRCGIRWQPQPADTLERECSAPSFAAQADSSHYATVGFSAQTIARQDFGRNTYRRLRWLSNAVVCAPFSVLNSSTTDSVLPSTT